MMTWGMVWGGRLGATLCVACHCRNLPSREAPFLPVKSLMRSHNPMQGLTEDFASCMAFCRRTSQRLCIFQGQGFASCMALCRRTTAILHGTLEVHQPARGGSGRR
mmetsp:Transcript_31162/g.92933  ORF Transcript_31162/g.92933 Transcript_31162/m.92933 type:complete len:106 (-) Transcript_31162:781-1098(-)|eukprot:361278-Chlamydomonas_euryale.AAC.4